MKKTGTLIVLTLLTFSTFSQVQEVVSSSGDNYNNSSGSIQYTLGEVVISTVSNSNSTITQGFHQTKWDFVGLEDYSSDFDVTVYPNPISERLTIRATAFSNIQYKMHDAIGRIIFQGTLNAETTPIDVISITPGAYSITLYDQNESKLKTFKLVKNH